MHQRDVLAAGGGTLSDAPHQVLAAVTVFLMFLAIGFGVTAFGKRFCLYSIVTIVVLLVFGGLTFMEAPHLQMNLPTTWIGLWERINISVFLLWVVVLAAVLWRPVPAQRDGAMKPSLVAALGARAVLPAFGLRFRNRRDMNAGRAGRAAVEGHVISTPSGKALRFAAIASVAVYALGDLASGLLYEGYSYRDQWISELSAFGSPVRPLMVTAILVHGLLLLAFGAGIWRFADRRSLRSVGLLLIVAGVIGLPTHTVFAMSSRSMTAGFNDTMHASLSLAFGLVVFVAVALSAVAYPGRFRLYAIVTIAILVGFGAASSAAIQGIEQNFTPWAGGFERINAYSYFAWLIVLALTVRRSRTGNMSASASRA